MNSCHKFMLRVVLGTSAALAGCAHDRPSGLPPQYSGQRLYEMYCANCHGADGTGHGPAEPYLTGRPADLTRIFARNGGAFPADRVFRTIDGQYDSPPPGARHMPIWGYDLFDAQEDDERAHQRVLDAEHLLVKYIESIQAPAPARGQR